jgi:hypothetical protein
MQDGTGGLDARMALKVLKQKILKEYLILI